MRQSVAKMPRLKIVIILTCLAIATQAENCFLIGRFLAPNSSFDFSLLDGQVMLLSNLRLDNDYLSPSIYLALTLSRNIYIYDESILTFQGFIEDTFKDASCVMLVDGSERDAKEALIEVINQGSTGCFRFKGQIKNNSSP